MSPSGHPIRTAVLVSLVAALLLAAAPGALAGGPGMPGADGARQEASRLIERMNAVGVANPSDPAVIQTWRGATTAEPLLVRSLDGNPSEYIVPVVDSGGRTISVIAVGAVDGCWHWYSREFPYRKFPLVDAGEAASKVRNLLRERGISSKMPEPEARMAPDKLIYWFFRLPSGRTLKEVYLPVFLEDRPYTNLETAPWKKAKSDDTGGAPPVAPSGGRAVQAPSPRGGEPPSAYDIANVPYHTQETSFWCGSASLEMVFDYWGPDINQAEIAGVADSRSSYGCYADDLERAAQFSYLSTSVQDPSLHGYTARQVGYAASSAMWSGSALFNDRYTDLKSIVSQNFPFLVLTYFDQTHASTHFRVVKGYSDAMDTIKFHDPWYQGSISGPDCEMRQSLFVDDLWEYSERWGMVACPWFVNASKPASVAAGQTFDVGATVSYPAPVSTLTNQHQCSSASALLQLPSGYQVESGLTEVPLDDMAGTGTSDSANWTVRATTGHASTDDIVVEGKGMIDGSSRAYRSYEDMIGLGTAGPGPFKPTSRVWGHDSVGVPESKTTWYLAEGSTAGGMETFVLVQNPGSSPANIEIKYMTASGPVTGPKVALAPNSRRTFNVGDTVPGEWEVSTGVTSDLPVIAERAMYGNGRTWGHDSVGVPEAQLEWYLAEGSTAGGMETFVLVQNPNDETASVRLTYMTASGPVTGQSATLPPNSRRTFNVAEKVPNEWQVSTKVTSTDRPVIAERAMYGNNRTWGHDSVGVSEAYKTWYLAEGSTSGGMETFVLVQNPNDTPANVAITYMTTTGPIAGPEESLAPNSRKTFNVSDYAPGEAEVSTRVVSIDEPVIAERAMYGGNRTWGHDSVGVSDTSVVWYLAEGSTGAGFETWVLVQNPNSTPALVSITYMTPQGPIVGPADTLPANSRKTYNVAGNVPNTWEVSTMVTSDRGVIAERAMYGDPN